MGEKKIETSTLTEKYQATIPRNVRKFLGLGKGDKVAFEIGKDGKVIIRPFKNQELEYLKSIETTLTEWDSKEDDEAYVNL